MSTDQTKRRGFAAMDPEQHRALASAGGKAAHAIGRAHRFTSEEARAAGRLGGLTHSREHFVEIGRRGGNTVAADRKHMAEIGKLGGASRGQQ